MMARYKKYWGLTYPAFLAKWPFSWLWKWYMCPRDVHLLDEVLSPCTEADKRAGFYENYLSCDICGVSVERGWVDVKYMDKKVLAKRELLKKRSEE